MQLHKNSKVYLSGLCLLFLVSLVYPLVAQQAATSEKAMVVAPTPEAVDAGLTILRQGGNAVDAAAVLSRRSSKRSLMSLTTE